VAVVVAPAAAQADVVSLRGEIHGGGAFGKGISGDAKDEAFFETAPHGVYGILAGVEFFFIDVWLQHHQFTNGDRLSTWTQLAVGFDVQVPFGDEGQPDVSGKRPGAKNYAEVGFGLGFGLGTGQQVDPPLDNSEVTDKGFTLGGKFAFGKHLGKNLDFGLMVPVQYHYMFKTCPDAVCAVNNLDNHYQGVAVEALLFLRIYIKII